MGVVHNLGEQQREQAEADFSLSAAQRPVQDAGSRLGHHHGRQIERTASATQSAAEGTRPVRIRANLLESNGNRMI